MNSMINGFIYEWIDLSTGLKYIGRHEGSVDDGYVGSGTSFIVEYESRPNDFVRNLIWEGKNITVEELIRQEEYFLSLIPDDEFYFGKNRKYYNKVKNSSGFTSMHNPMKVDSIVEQMKETRKRLKLNNTWQNTVKKYGYEAACRMNASGDKSLGGKANKGKPKTEEHKKKIAQNHKGGRKKACKESNI